MTKLYLLSGTSAARVFAAMPGMPRIAHDAQNDAGAAILERIDAHHNETKGFLADNKAAVDKLAGDVKGLSDRVDDIEKKGNRPRLGDTADGAKELKALGRFARTGDDAELKAMSVGSDPDGGYLVHPVLSSTMTKKIFDATPMRRLARVETITAGDAFEEPLDIDDVGASWVAETEARPETSTPQVGVLRVPVEEIYAMPKLSQRMIDDSGFDVATWLENKVADRFSRVEGTAFVTGDGVKKPRGFLNYPTSAAADSSRPWGTLQTVPSGNATNITADSLRDLTWSLRAPYRQGASWLMSSITASQLDKLKDGMGNYLWRSSAIAGAADELLGYPVEIDENMPSVAAGSNPIAFGNFKLAYLIVDKAGIKWLRDPYSNKPWVLVYGYRRVGGGLAHSEAIKLMTVSV